MYISHDVNLKELKAYVPSEARHGKFPAGNIILHLFHALHRVLPGEFSINCCEINSGIFYHVISAPLSTLRTPILSSWSFLRTLDTTFSTLSSLVLPFCTVLCCGSCGGGFIYLFTPQSPWWAVTPCERTGEAVHFHL